MRSKQLKELPKFKSDEEFGQFVLDHDMTEYFDLSKAKPVVFPNLRRSPHVVPLSIPDDEFIQLNALAAQKKKSVGEFISQLIKRSLKDLRANPSGRS
jgi:hypothetical protein